MEGGEDELNMQERYLSQRYVLSTFGHGIFESINRIVNYVIIHVL